MKWLTYCGTEVVINLTRFYMIVTKFSNSYVTLRFSFLSLLNKFRNFDVSFFINKLDTSISLFEIISCK